MTARLSLVRDEAPVELPAPNRRPELDVDEIERETAFGRAVVASVVTVVLAALGLAAAVGLRALLLMMLGLVGARGSG